MMQTTTPPSDSEDDVAETDMRKRVGALLLSVLLILVFMFGIAPLMDKLPFVQPLIQFIEERDIDASALYYTEIEEFSEAEIHIRNTMDYQPRNR